MSPFFPNCGTFLVFSSVTFSMRTSWQFSTAFEIYRFLNETFGIRHCCAHFSLFAWRSIFLLCLFCYRIHLEFTITLEYYLATNLQIADKNDSFQQQEKSYFQSFQYEWEKSKEKKKRSHRTSIGAFFSKECNGNAWVETYRRKHETDITSRTNCGSEMIARFSGQFCFSEKSNINAHRNVGIRMMRINGEFMVSLFLWTAIDIGEIYANRAKDVIKEITMEEFAMHYLHYLVPFTKFDYHRRRRRRRQCWCRSNVFATFNTCYAFNPRWDNRVGLH